MLIEFTVKNFRSIRREAHFSMVMGAGKEWLANNVHEFTEASAPLNPVLRSAAVYGANAAGKTNLLRSLEALRAVVAGSTQRNPGDSLPVKSFSLSPDTRNAPTEFEVHFVVDSVRYQYGIVVDSATILEEWLFAFPKGRAQKWFERIPSSDGNGTTIKFGDKLRGERELWERVTRPNASLLATAAQLNSEQLTPIFEWFSERLKIAVGQEGWNQKPGATIQLSDSQQQEQTLKFLQAADFAISGFNVNEVESGDLEKITQDLPPQLRDMLHHQLSDSRGVQIMMEHETEDEKTLQMDLSQESDGTQKMFCYAGPWMDTLANGNVMVIDELHDNLHPLLVQFLVAMFHNPDINKYGAQLIFSTHETAILNQDLFRRDQIWFCERDADQSTNLYPLSDFAVRKGTENLERGYLTGRYGALPLIKEFAG